MPHQTEDLRIRTVRPLLPPAILHEEIPVTEGTAVLVENSRRIIDDILNGRDRRLFVIVGPCSIHDVEAAVAYAHRLKTYADQFKDDLFLVMRCYFEKPRTTVGWKGLVNDPRMDGSFQINEGLRLARRLLADVGRVGLPAGTEFLDTTIPQHLADLVSWGCIGARTTESQTHRELASGLSMPVGFKNATDGNVQTAIDALKAARQPHWFPGATKEGVSAIVQSSGNSSCHVVLRGGSRTGPNYGEQHVRNASSILQREGLPHRVMIDLSHANSDKDFRKQPLVAADVAGQLRRGGSPIFGVMIESNLVEGKQDIQPGKPLTYGQSVTDGCISIEQTGEVLSLLASAMK
ncbi:MAG TPA: 3-deoxy-7-phosphoheptulonate synthase [Fimbriimonas sp.]|nr:3-deoxy-7-phosphoheptulonate synthase [Fimbriimonas sp.]